eukprot:753541-Hanusia_phi.AAC.5
MLSIAPFKISKGLKRSCRREKVHNSSWSYLSSSSRKMFLSSITERSVSLFKQHGFGPTPTHHSIPRQAGPETFRIWNRSRQHMDRTSSTEDALMRMRQASERNLRRASTSRGPCSWTSGYETIRSPPLTSMFCRWLRHIITMRKKKLSMSEKSSINQASMSLDERLLHATMNKQSEDELRTKKEEIERSIVEHYNGRSPFSNHLTSYDRETLHAIDQIQAEVSFILNLYPGGFSVHSPTDNEMLTEPRAYDPSSKKFLQSLDRGSLPLDLLNELPGNVDFKYEQGCIVIEVRDYRQPRQYDLRPSTHRMILRPDASSLQQDLKQIWQIHANLSVEDILILEKLLLLTTKPTLCLDPSPGVQVVANYMHRKSDRLQVWHKKTPRPTTSEFRHEFDAAVLKRAHASAHLFNRDPQSMERLEKYAHRRIIRDREKFCLAPATRDSLFASQAMKEPLEEQDDKVVGGVVQETLHGMAKILRHLKPQAAQEDGDPHREHAIISRFLLRVVGVPGAESKVCAGLRLHWLLHLTRQNESSADHAQDAAAANKLIPPPQPRGGLPPERQVRSGRSLLQVGSRAFQMRFKKNRQLATIWIQLRAASSYHGTCILYSFTISLTSAVMMRIDDIGPDGKAVEGTQAVVHPLIVGNSRIAQLYGSQQVEGAIVKWACSQRWCRS